MKAMLIASLLLLAACETTSGPAAPKRQMSQDEALMWMMLSQGMMQPAPRPATPAGPRLQCYTSGNATYCY